MTLSSSSVLGPSGKWGNGNDNTRRSSTVFPTALTEDGQQRVAPELSMQRQ